MDPEIGMMEQWSGRGRIEDDRIEEAAADKVGADKTQFGTMGGKIHESPHTRVL